MSPKKDSEFDFHTPPTFTYAGHTLDQEQYDEMLQDVSRTLAKGDPIVVVVDSDYEVQKNPTVLLNCVAAGDGGENFHGENQASVKREEMQRQEFPSRFGYSSKKRLLEPQGTPEQIMNDALSSCGCSSCKVPRMYNSQPTRLALNQWSKGAEECAMRQTVTQCVFLILQ